MALSQSNLRSRYKTNSTREKKDVASINARIHNPSMHKIFLPKGSVVKVNGFPVSLRHDAQADSGTPPSTIFGDGIPQAAGGKARARKLGKEKCSEQARRAAKARWSLAALDKKFKANGRVIE